MCPRAGTEARWSDVMARQAPEGLAGIHVNMPATVPPEIAKALQAGDPPPTGLSEVERSHTSRRHGVKGAAHGHRGYAAAGQTDGPAAGEPVGVNNSARGSRG